ncbi:MAG: substrate-binding domain-containing protein [Thermacetogeniaceae bacterium]|jgi:ribose transport system substrate-binding protein
MRLGKLVLSGLLIICMLAIYGCGNTDAVTNGTDEGAFTIGYSNMDINNVHFVKISDAIKDYLEPLGHNFVEINADNDSAKQISDVEDLIAQGCDAILISPVDSKGIKTALQACVDAGIPAIIVDVLAEDVDLPSCQIATDNYLCGVQIAEYLIELSGGTAKVAIVDYSISTTVNERIAGFMDTIADYPEIVILDQQDAIPTIDAGLELVENYLQAHQDITDIFCFNDLTAQGALNACKGAGRTEIRIYGVDGNTDNIQLIANGSQIVATSAQFPAVEGKTAAEVALKILAGDSVDSYIPVSPALVNIDNAADYL